MKLSAEEMKTLVAITAVFSLCGISEIHAQRQATRREAKALGPAQYYWLLNRACAFGDEIGARMLLDAGADINGESDYKELAKTGFGIEPSWPINLAAHGGHEEVLKLIIKRGARIDHPEGDGYTALILAVQQGHESVVRLLLEAGANPNFRGWEGTPIEIARKKKDTKILELLTNNSEQPGTGQPATRPKSDSGSSDKAQPESEGRSR